MSTSVSTVGPVSAGGSAAPASATEIAPTSLLADLAALVAKAVASGDLALASALIAAQSKAAPVAPAPVVDLAAARARRGK